jgi:hypothetical protein
VCNRIAILQLLTIISILAHIKDTIHGKRLKSRLSQIINLKMMLHFHVSVRRCCPAAAPGHLEFLIAGVQRRSMVAISASMRVPTPPHTSMSGRSPSPPFTSFTGLKPNLL